MYYIMVQPVIYIFCTCILYMILYMYNYLNFGRVFAINTFGTGRIYSS